MQPQFEDIHEEMAQLERDIVNTDNKVTALDEELQEQEENINHLDDTKADKTEIPDVSKFVTNTVNNLTHYYLKQDIYTKEEVLELIGKIKTTHLKKVEELPEIGEENIIYLVPKHEEHQEFDDICYEYIWDNEQWETIGLTQIDLSNYVTIDNLENTLADYYNKEEIEEMNKAFATTASLIAAINGCEPKIPNTTDLMFQSVMYGGGESGYRKYRNGMLEQWGVATSSANGEYEFTMHQSHIDTKFSIFIEPRERGNFFHYALPTANQKFACRIQTRDSLNIAIKFQWRSWGRWK